MNREALKAALAAYDRTTQSTDGGRTAHYLANAVRAHLAETAPTASHEERAQRMHLAWVAMMNAANPFESTIACVERLAAEFAAVDKEAEARGVARENSRCAAIMARR